MLLAAVTGLGVNALVEGLPLVGNWSVAGQSKIIHQGSQLPGQTGIHYIETSAAEAFLRSGQGKIVDVRTSREYALGHLPGAILCNYYKLDKYLPALLAKASFDEPLMLYCIGDDCEDSGFLAGALQEMGYGRIYIYLGGYEGWKQAGLPVVEDAGKEPGRDEPARPLNTEEIVDFTRLIPTQAWLWVDLALLAYGILALYFLVTVTRINMPVKLGLKLVGVIFAAASLHKIDSPLLFAGIVNNYKLLPGAAVNTVAITMPWLELLCGLLLVLGRWRQAAAVMLTGLTGVFILAVGFNWIRGLDFDCGCFGSGHISPLQILVRDTGLFLCCLPGVFFADTEKRKQRS
ncbi:MAG: MauE/DoxX family redox-associated membrane protein [Gemmatimonadota bacterium]|nr:MauE/DoxX family redox-associated membrane protein [Gemmatimonadota bacterium]